MMIENSDKNTSMAEGKSEPMVLVIQIAPV
jgi:hypothetical protein